MAIIAGGVHFEIPGLASTSFDEDPRLALRHGRNMARRISPLVRGIVLHTTKGIPGGRDRRAQVIRPGFGKPVDAGKRCASSWTSAKNETGAHLVVDFDGHVSCCADLVTASTYHANQTNQATIGIEIYQGSDAELYEGQLDATVLVIDELTRRLGIQRMIPDEYRGALQRFSIVGAAGKDYFGVYGHRDVSNQRDLGDPGDAIFERLERAGYERFNLERYADFDAWGARQRAFQVTPADGVPGPKTVAAMRAAGVPHGVWIRRPGDAVSATRPRVS